MLITARRNRCARRSVRPLVALTADVLNGKPYNFPMYTQRQINYAASTIPFHSVGARSINFPPSASNSVARS